MPHSQQHADRWLQLISQHVLPGSETFASHVAAGQITSLCTCGCHGFEFSIPDGADLPPLTRGSGLYCELAFHSNAAEEIDILLFTDARGYFSGADVTFGQANIGPMPDDTVATALIGVWPSDNLAGT
jgi:hypothetical protein